MADLAQAEQARKDAEKAERSAQENPSAGSFRTAAGKWGAAANLYRQLAEKGEVDWCTAAEAYLQAANDLVAQADLEKDPTDAVSDLREAARMFDQAGDLFMKCGDAAMSEEDYSKAIGACARAAYGYGRRSGIEQVVENYYKALLEKNPQDGVASGQRGEAEKRRKEAEKRRERAKETQKKAREKFLEVSFNTRVRKERMV